MARKVPTDDVVLSEIKSVSQNFITDVRLSTLHESFGPITRKISSLEEEIQKLKIQLSHRNQASWVGILADITSSFLIFTGVGIAAKLSTKLFSTVGGKMFQAVSRKISNDKYASLKNHLNRITENDLVSIQEITRVNLDSGPLVISSSQNASQYIRNIYQGIDSQNPNLGDFVDQYMKEVYSGYLLEFVNAERVQPSKQLPSNDDSDLYIGLESFSEYAERILIPQIVKFFEKLRSFYSNCNSPLVKFILYQFIDFMNTNGLIDGKVFRVFLQHYYREVIGSFGRQVLFAGQQLFDIEFKLEEIRDPKLYSPTGGRYKRRFETRQITDRLEILNTFKVINKRELLRAKRKLTEKTGIITLSASKKRAMERKKIFGLNLSGEDASPGNGVLKMEEEYILGEYYLGYPGIMEMISVSTAIGRNINGKLFYQSPEVRRKIMEEHLGALEKIDEKLIAKRQIRNHPEISTLLEKSNLYRIRFYCIAAHVKDRDGRLFLFLEMEESFSIGPLFKRRYVSDYYYYLGEIESLPGFHQIATDNTLQGYASREGTDLGWGSSVPKPQYLRYLELENIMNSDLIVKGEIR